MGYADPRGPMSDERTYSLEELAQATGTTTHRIRHWVRRGLIPPTVPRGPHTRYDDEHRLWIKAIGLAMAGGMSSQEASDHVQALETIEDIAVYAGELVPVPPAPPPAPEPVASATSPGERAIWERVPICAGVELHVSMGADAEAQNIARAIELAFGKSGRAR